MMTFKIVPDRLFPDKAWFLRRTKDLLLGGARQRIDLPLRSWMAGRAVVKRKRGPRSLSGDHGGRRGNSILAFAIR